MSVDVGENIRKARKIRELTQIDVAEMAEIAVNSLRLYEAGKRTPNLEQLQRIAGAIGVEWTSLVDGDLIWHDEYAVFNGKQKKTHAVQKGGDGSTEGKAGGLDLEDGETRPSNRYEHSLGTVRAGKSKALYNLLRKAPQHRVAAAWDKLNEEGQEKAAERVEELTEIPRYQAQQAPQPSAAPSEGSSTTPPADGAEGPQEGE